MSLIYLLPSVGAAIGVLNVFMTYYCLWHTLRKGKMKIVQRLDEQLNDEDFKTDFGELLNEKLDGFIDNLRSQIPMGAMLLTPALSEKIKSIVKEEIVKLIPDIKGRMLNRLSSEMRIETILLNFLRPELFRIVIYGAILGFIVGLLLLLGTER